MPWNPEDWNCWLTTRYEAVPGERLHVRACRDVVRRIPDSRGKTVASVESDLRPQIDFLVEHFARVVTLRCATLSERAAERDRDAVVLPLRRDRVRTPAGVGARFDVIVAVDSILGPRVADVNRALARVHDNLVEGGILLATFPATPRGEPRPMALATPADADAAPFHEVELQYRLHRVGFQGARIRRFDGPGGDDALLCMAVRRANN